MWIREPIALHIVPEGRKTAASKPSSSATRSHSALTVGSPKCCSSPTSASAIALRISGVGRVWVSEDRLTLGTHPTLARRGVGGTDSEGKGALPGQALDALLELLQARARLPVGADQTGVEALGLRRAEPAVHVDPLDPLVLLGELEEVLRRLAGARRRVLEARRLELDQAARLGQPELAPGDAEDALDALALVAVDVVVVVQAPDPALVLRRLLEPAQVAVDVALVEQVGRQDRALLARALHRLPVLDRQLRALVRGLRDVVDLVPGRERLRVGELLAERLDRLLVGLDARRLAGLRLLVPVVHEAATTSAELDEHVLLGDVRAAHERLDLVVLERDLRVVPRHDVAGALELQLLEGRAVEHGGVLLREAGTGLGLGRGDRQQGGHERGDGED